jgi:hypothetical protein
LLWWVLVLAAIDLGLETTAQVALAQATNPSPGDGGPGGGTQTPPALPTIFVTTLADDGPGSLRDAIRTVPAGATIAFAIPTDAPGCQGNTCVITLTSGELVIDKNLAIMGPGPAYLQIERAASAPRFRIFRITSFRTVTIHGVKIHRGVTDNGGGGGILNRGTLTLTHSVIASSHALIGSLVSMNGQGGGIANTENATLRAASVTMTDNLADLGGGAIYNATGGTVTVTNSTLQAN